MASFHFDTSTLRLSQDDILVVHTNSDVPITQEIAKAWMELLKLSFKQGGRDIEKEGVVMVFLKQGQTIESVSKQYAERVLSAITN